MKSLFTLSLLIFAQILFAQTPLSFNDLEILIDNESVGDKVLFENVGSVDGETINMYAEIMETSDPIYIASMNFALDYVDEFKFMLKDNNAGPGTSVWATVKYSFVYSSDNRPVNISFNLLTADLDFNSSLIKESVAGVPNQIHAYCLEDPTRLIETSLCTYEGSNFTNPINANTAVIFEYASQSEVMLTYTIKKYNSISSNSSFMMDGNGNLVSYNNMKRFLVNDVLPVEIIDFDVHMKSKEKEVIVSWETVNEINLSHFEIERSTNGIDFEKVSKTLPILGQGHKSYQFDDRQFNGLKIYYRIKIVDYDGQFDYTSIKFVEAEKDIQLQLSVYPNPVVNQVNITTEEGIQSISIFDLNGTLIKTLSGNGTFYQKVDISNISKKHLLLTIVLDKGQTFTRQIFKF